MLYAVYNFFSTVLFLAILPFLPILLLFGKRFRTGLAQRLGFYPADVLKGVAGSRPIWIHAASVGEVTVAVELTHELKKSHPEKKVIISTFTDTGNDMARRARIADAVLFLPLDQYWLVRRTLRMVDPAALIILETEMWPNLVRQAGAKGIPTLLLSGRLSSRSFRKYSLVPAFFRQVLRSFSALGMQSEEDAQRVINLGADFHRVSVVGNLKRAISTRRLPRNGNGTDGETTQHRRTSAPPLLVVGSSHRGEEEILLAVYLSLKERFARLRMVLAPRHPERFADVERLLQAKGLDYQKKSHANGRLDFSKDILLLDTLGDLQDFYALADVAFVGGSLVDAGGHNLLEPARLGKPVLFGPFTGNFASLALEMKQRGAAIQVAGAEDLTRQLSDLLADPEKCRAMGKEAYRVAAEDYGVMERNLALAQRYL